MRPATLKDLPRIVAIYNAVIPEKIATADPEPVTVAAKTDWFHSHSEDHYPLLVHEKKNEIIAWVSFQPFYGRPAYQYTAEISIYINKIHRGQGLGKQLLQESLTIAHELGFKTLLGFIFAHNRPSIRLFKDCGFQCWGTLPHIAEMKGQEYSLSIYGRRLTAAGAPRERPVIP